MAGFVRKRSQVHGVPFESELDTILRHVMNEATDSKSDDSAEPFTYEPFSVGFLPDVDVENLRRYVDDLEDEELKRKMYGEDQS